MTELEDKIYSEIQSLSQLGDSLVETENYQGALVEYWKAFNLLPEPKTDWEAATWLLAAIGDVNFSTKDYQAGVENISNAMNCPDAIGNPFLHLRLGQCQYEIGNLDKAADELTRAYGIEGKKIFKEDDPKYFDFLKTKIQIEEPKIIAKPKKKPWWKL